MAVKGKKFLTELKLQLATGDCNIYNSYLRYKERL